MRQAYHRVLRITVEPHWNLNPSDLGRVAKLFSITVEPHWNLNKTAVGTALDSLVNYS